MKRNLILITIAIVVPFFSQSQNMDDALRYSQTNIEGTARSGAMGNAFGALGGDFTSVSINPAGIGLYRSGEFVVTPKSGNTSIESLYYGNTIKDTDFKFTMSNISYVAPIPVKKDNSGGLVNVNIGIGFNRLKDFSSRMMMEGNSVDGSYLDYFADNANADIWSDYYEQVVWDADLLIYDEDNKQYFHDIQDAGYGQYQRKTVSKNGSLDEYSLALGLNFNHKFYLGASLGITDLYYTENSQIYEDDAQNNINYLNEYAFNSFLETSGYGTNFKIGAIFKPVNEIRLGISVQTPTYYKLNDLFETDVQSYITYGEGDSETYDELSPTSRFEYRLRTPFKTTFSGAFVISKKGLISVDYELVDYSSSQLSVTGNDYEFDNENIDISQAFTTAGNLRIGGEYRLNNAFSLRGGYEFHGSAYNERAFNANQPNSDANLNVYSAGLGYKSGFFFFDVAFRHSVINSFDLPYMAPVSNDYPAPQIAELNTVKNNMLFTLGYRF